MIRIIAGSARGIVLRTPKGMATRPTLNQVRESIFNVLANIGIMDTRVLDIFAGTGAMGLEALSRGAAKAVFIDKATLRCLRENAEKAGMIDKSSFISRDVYTALETLRGQTFDYVFMDPPYCRGYVDQVLKKITECSLLADEAVVTVEHSADESPEEEFLPAHFRIWKTKKFGGTVITYLQYENEPEGEL